MGKRGLPAAGEAVNGTPSAAPFRVDVRPDRQRVLVVPHGELDMATTGEVTASIDDLVHRGFAAVVLDLRAVSFMDSTGLRMVLAQTSRDDARITVVDGSECVPRVFDLAGVRHFVPFEAAP